MRCFYRDKLLDLKQRRLQRRFSAAQLIQARWRGYFIRKSYVPVLEAMKKKRKERDRKIALLRSHCAVRIQALWRGYSIRSVYGPTLAALRDERVKTKENLERNRTAMATFLQAVWRGYLARRKYGPMLITRLEEWKQQRRYRRQYAATTLQACWRGFCARRRVKPQLLQLKYVRVALDEQRRKAALVLQTHWRRHGSRVSCRHKLMQKQCCSEEVHQDCTTCAIVNVSSVDKDVSDAPSNTVHGKLTVMKRLQSALRLQLQGIDTRIGSGSVEVDVSDEQNTTAENPYSSMEVTEGGIGGDLEVHTFDVVILTNFNKKDVRCQLWCRMESRHDAQQIFSTYTGKGLHIST